MMLERDRKLLADGSGAVNELVATIGELLD